MKPAPFRYFAPHSVEEALSLLAEHGDEAKVLAGGQSLIPTMNFRLAQPRVLVDINRLAELSFLRQQKGELRIGALTRHRDLERSDLAAQQAPLVHEAVPYISHPQIRNRGTVGGSIAHADPAAELPALMVALDARFHVRSQKRETWIPVSDFFTGLFGTCLEPDDLLVEVALPELPRRTGWAFGEIARRHGDYALLGVAAVVTLDRKGRCQRSRLIFLSAGDAPVEAREAQLLLEGETPSPELAVAAAQAAAHKDIDPPNDIHATARYRRRLAEILTEEALARAFARCA